MPVLITTQIPIADLRRLVPQNTHRLTAPSWPSAEAGREFIRTFGGVKPRWLGGVGPWAGEEVFCDVRGAVTFPGRRGVWAPGATPKAPRFKWAFRRFLADGRVVTRIELGLSCRARAGDGRPWALEAVAMSCFAGDLALRSTDGKWSQAPVFQAGAPLARLLLRSTTKRDGFNPEESWLRPGRPLLLLEYDPSLEAMSPPPGRIVPILWDEGIDVSYRLLEANANYAGAWFVAANRANCDAVRRLRIHLFRLHAERECLKQVLLAITRDVIRVERGTAESETLQDYLNSAFTLIFEPSFGIPSGEIFKAAYETDQLIAEGERASLLERLNQVRGNIRRKVAERTEGGWFPS